jgi:deoxycytidine triphosphate deaminase
MDTTNREDRPLEGDVCDYYGIIRDAEIRSAIERDLLLVKDTADMSRVRQASYELRLSDRVEYLILQDGKGGNATAKYERPADGIGPILRIDPGQTVKVEVKETFNLPTNVAAHVIPVGNIYKLGLSPETTYADPGYDGDFFIILSNFSPRVVEVPVGEPIARVEFVRLAKETSRPHPGSKQRKEPKIWPRRIEKLTKQDLQGLGIDGLLKRLDEKDPPHCEHAYVAREVHTMSVDGSKSLQDLTARVSALEGKIASFKRHGFIALATFIGLAVLALSPWWWPLLPQAVRTQVPEGIGKAVGAFFGGIVGAWLKSIYDRKR